MNPDSPQTQHTDPPSGDQNPPSDPPDQGEAAQPATAASSEAPEWQAPGYDGPLDLNQAVWRNRHLKPAVASVQKAAGKQGSKAR